MRLGRIFTRASGESALEVRDLHNAPRRQLIFLASGLLELESSEGRRVLCRPGDLIFAEDTAGKGHVTRSLRGTRGFVHVAMPADFDVSQWPLAERLDP